MPDIREIPDDGEAIGSTAGDDHHVELLLAGFRACAKEAIRFLLEEEGLAPDHELPTGLQEHLDRQQNHLAGMLQNDSGLGHSGMDGSFCHSSADDESFLTSASDHELLASHQEHLDRQQSHLEGMLQNDSGFGCSGMDDSLCHSSADDESFLTSEPCHELSASHQEHLDRQQSHLSGILQNDSGFGCSGMDGSLCHSSADDESFLTSEPCHELPTSHQEHLGRQQSHLARMLQNDFGFECSGMDDSLCHSSADDESFLTSEPCHELPISHQEHLGRQQRHIAGIPQNDSGMGCSGMDFRFCHSSAKDESFLASETSDMDCNNKAPNIVKSSTSSNASIDIIHSSHTNPHLREPSLKDSSP